TGGARMNCDELRDEYGAYALGVAEDPERSEIAGHLARNCPNCTPGVRGAMTTVSAMSAAVKTVDPPRRLRRRILKMVEPEPKGLRAAILIPWAIAAALAIALVSIALPEIGRAHV